MRRTLLFVLSIALVASAQAKPLAQETWLAPGEPLRLLIQVVSGANVSFETSTEVFFQTESEQGTGYELRSASGTFHLPKGEAKVTWTNEGDDAVLLDWRFEGEVEVVRTEGVHHLPPSAWRTPAPALALTLASMVLALRGTRT